MPEFLSYVKTAMLLAIDKSHAVAEYPCMPNIPGMDLFK